MIFSEKMLMFVVVSFLGLLGDGFLFPENDLFEEVSLDSEVCDYDVKNLQRKITEGKMALLRFQKLAIIIRIPTPCGPSNLPGVRKKAPYCPRVQGFWCDENGTSVVIDGNMFQMGQYLPDRISKVISITKDGVVIKRRGKKFVLPFDAGCLKEKSEK